MTTGYQINGTDTDDLFVRKDLFSEGGLWLWGDNTNGKLGTNDVASRSSPVQTIAGGTNWKQVSAGTNHTAAIKTDGTLWLWGLGTFGRLGTNDIAARSSPVQTISGGTNWKQVSTGTDHTAAIKTDGTLWVWGNSSLNGQLGTNDTVHRSSPVQTVAGGTNWKQVSTGSDHTVAIKTDGTLWVWGEGINGTLGTNDVADRSSPVQVGADTNWKQVSAGGRITAAIKTDGTLWTWGQNAAGNLGLNDTVHRSSPVQVGTNTNWKQINVHNLATNVILIAMAGIKTDGTLWLWGGNNDGQLGTNDTVHRSSPVQTVAGGTDWKQVDAGGETSAIKTDGTLWVWGSGISGQLGANDVAARSSPIQTVAGGTNWKQVSTGSSMIAAVREDYWA